MIHRKGYSDGAGRAFSRTEAAFFTKFRLHLGLIVFQEQGQGRANLYALSAPGAGFLIDDRQHSDLHPQTVAVMEGIIEASRPPGVTDEIDLCPQSASQLFKGLKGTPAGHDQCVDLYLHLAFSR